MTLPRGGFRSVGAAEMALAGSEDISNTLCRGHCVSLWLTHHMVSASALAQPRPCRSILLVAFPPEGLELSFVDLFYY